jgi:hypothetical protein
MIKKIKDESRISLSKASELYLDLIGYEYIHEKVS